MISDVRLDELQTWLFDMADAASPEESGWYDDAAAAVGELIARRRVEKARSK
jgi:hypothetical protein